MEDDTLKAELQDLGRRIRDARAALGAFLKQEADDHVYWVEQTGKTQHSHSLQRRADRCLRPPAASALSPEP